MISKYNVLIIGLISRVCSSYISYYRGTLDPYYFPIPTYYGFQTTGDSVDYHLHGQPPAVAIGQWTAEPQLVNNAQRLLRETVDRSRAEGPMNDHTRPWYGGAGFGHGDVNVYPYPVSPHRWNAKPAWPGHPVHQVSEDDEKHLQKRREDVERRSQRMEQQKREYEKRIRDKVKQRSKLLQRRYFDLALHREHDDGPASEHIVVRPKTAATESQNRKNRND